MEQEEAIKLLGSLFLVAEVLKVDKETREKIKTALNMAIKALQEQTHDKRTETHGVCLGRETSDGEEESC